MIRKYLQCLIATKQSIDAEAANATSTYNALVEAIKTYNKEVCRLSVRVHQASQVAAFISREAEDVDMWDVAEDVDMLDIAEKADSIGSQLNELVYDIPPAINIEG